MAQIQLSYFSNALQKAQQAICIVPQTPGPYHVLFQLHGLSDDHTIWARRTSIERYVEGLPLIVVMPDGGRGFYCDAVEGYKYGTALGKELPDLIEQWFPTKPGWAVGGLSMGGYGCVRLAFNHPDRFISAASHSGAMAFAHSYGAGDDDFGREFGRILGPDYQGGNNDLFAMAEKVDPKPKLRIDCGVDDFLIESNRSFHQHLEDIGYDHEYAEFPGAHTWDYWDMHVQEALAFHRKNLGF